MTNEEKKFQEIWDEANELGNKYAAEAELKMIRPYDAYSGRIYPPFPICGFAWVNIKPATIRFARWLKENNYGRTSDRGGVTVWISEHDQSYDRKLAHARGMAEVFEKHGFDASYDGRLD